VWTRKPEAKSGRIVKMPVGSKDLSQAKKRVVERESCREIFKDDRLHVVEYPPQVRICKFDLYGHHEQRWLAMPYMQFTRLYGKQGISLHVSFTNTPIETIEQEVFFPPLPNIWYPSLQICLMSSPDGRFATVIHNFWNTRYLSCEDWYCFPVLDKETPMRTYQKWERMTQEDPSFILRVNWTHPTKICDIPKFDVGGPLCIGRSGKPEYGGSNTNRNNGPIRGFAVVPYNRAKVAKGWAE
jgi:hypothetical protein